jgi:hypothetical protein
MNILQELKSYYKESPKDFIGMALVTISALLMTMFILIIAAGS